MKKTWNWVIRQGALAVALKVAFTFAFHLAYPTIEILSGIHAVLSALAVMTAWAIFSFIKYFAPARAKSDAADAEATPV